MANVNFSIIENGYAPSEVDKYIDMLQQEYTNAVTWGQEMEKNLEELKTHNPDLIIASFHWGVESSAVPTDIQKKLAYTAIDNGT
ncbi:MAG: CapA family protein, partial [Clostridia bacterium]|nr:CapA family protein [Clostridia bacterium]